MLAMDARDLRLWLHHADRVTSERKLHGARNSVDKWTAKIELKRLDEIEAGGPVTIHYTGPKN